MTEAGVPIQGFDWDDANRRKIESRDGITVALVESVFEIGPWVRQTDHAHSAREPRFLVAGADSTGRAMIVIFTLRLRDGCLLIRPISARRMHRKEEAGYEKEA